MRFNLRRFVLPVTVFFVMMFSASVQAQINTPETGALLASPASGTNEGSSDVDDLLKFFTGAKSPIMDAKDMRATLLATLNNIVSSSQTSAIATGNALMKHCRAVFYAILGLVIAAEITFIGFKIMLRGSVVESFTQFTQSSFILAVVAGLTATQTPVTIIETAMYQLVSAGRNVGAYIIKEGLSVSTNNETLTRIQKQMAQPSVGPTSNTSSGSLPPSILSADSNTEPAMYWLTWLGIDNIKPLAASAELIAKKDKDPLAQNGSGEYKFSTASLMSRFWNDGAWGDKPAPTPSVNFKDAAAAIMVGMAPYRMLNMAMTIGTIQTGAVLAPVMQEIGVLAGALMTFYVVAALGVATLPLIYFKTYRGLWSRYLTILTGIALIPCFYYIFSAIGFVFAANMFEALFPIPQQGGPKSFAMVLNAVYISQCATALSNASILMEGGFTNIYKLVGGIFAWTLLLGRITFASGVVATFVTGGLAFSMMGGQIAYRWSEGFGAESMTDKVTEMFSGIQSSVGSGLSAMYSNFVNRSSQATGSFMKGAGGGK